MPLGAILGPLGAVLGPLVVVLWIMLPQINFRKHIKIDLGPILMPKRDPQRVQNGAKNDPKSKQESKMKKAAR